jgi:hypothetical protein
MLLLMMQVNWDYCYERFRWSLNATTKLTTCDMASGCTFVPLPTIRTGVCTMPGH